MGICTYVCIDFKGFQLLSHKCQNTDKCPFKPSLKSCDGIRFCFTRYKIPITYNDAIVLSKIQNRFSVVWLHLSIKNKLLNTIFRHLECIFLQCMYIRCL